MQAAGAGANILTNSGLNHFDSRRTVPLDASHAESVLGTNATALKLAIARFKESLPTIRHQIYSLPDVRNELMISNERPSPYKSWAQMQPRQPVQEDTLKSGEVQIERKTFVLILKENPRGRFLRISEDAVGRRNAIIIPSTGLAEFQKLLEEMIKVSNELPLKYPPET